MALLIMVDAATAIQEQTNRRPFPLRFSERERDSWAFFNFWCCLEIWFGLNRTSHPDWARMFGDYNGQIKLRAKQKFKLLSATNEYSKLIQKEYKTRHNWMGKVIYWELYKNLKFYKYWQIVHAKTRIHQRKWEA